MFVINTSHKMNNILVLGIFFDMIVLLIMITTPETLVTNLNNIALISIKPPLNIITSNIASDSDSRERHVGVCRVRLLLVVEACMISGRSMSMDQRAC